MRQDNRPVFLFQVGLSVVIMLLALRLSDSGWRDDTVTLPKTGLFWVVIMLIASLTVISINRVFLREALKEVAFLKKSREILYEQYKEQQDVLVESGEEGNTPVKGLRPPDFCIHAVESLKDRQLLKAWVSVKGDTPLPLPMKLDDDYILDSEMGTVDWMAYSVALVEDKEVFDVVFVLRVPRKVERA